MEWVPGDKRWSSFGILFHKLKQVNDGDYLCFNNCDAECFMISNDIVMLLSCKPKSFSNPC